MAYTPHLVSVQAVRKPLVQTWEGSFNFPISGGGHAIKTNPTNIEFSKTGSYGWAFWAKFDGDETVYRQIITLGTLSSNGYRIVKDYVGGRNILSFQENKNFSVDQFYYPLGFDVTQWHHIAVTWRGNSSSSVSTYCYINGRWITSKAASITWSGAVAATTPLTIGYDWADHTIGGKINDIGFFNNLLYPDDVFNIMYKRAFYGATSRWLCETNIETIVDSIGSNHLTKYNAAGYSTENQSWSRTRKFVTRS